MVLGSVTPIFWLMANLRFEETPQSSNGFSLNQPMSSTAQPTTGTMFPDGPRFMRPSARSGRCAYAPYTGIYPAGRWLLLLVR